MRAHLLWPALALTLLGTGLLCFSAVDAMHGYLFDRLEKTRLAETSRVAPKAPQPMLASGSGKVVGRIDIDRVRVSAVIVDSVEDASLRRAVGIVPGTPWPGTAGNTILAGHRDMHFRGLRNMRTGDEITITMPDQRLRYAVTSIRIMDIDAARRVFGDEADLTLLTCYPFSYIGPAPRRFVAEARLLP